MPWTLDIWHVDLRGAGDSTIIIARNGGVTRTAVIDAGEAGTSAAVHARLVALGIGAVDVMIATHYDADHFGGVTTLLNGGDPIYNATRIYDQGRQGAVSSKRRRLANGTFQVVATFSGAENPYLAYEQAIAAHGARVRVTGHVLSPGSLSHDLQNAGYEDADWLVGQDVLWDGVPAPAAGYPTLTCIAANQQVMQVGGLTREVTSGALTVDRNKNARSLAFLLRFGTFKYYVGGDIEARQEDGSDWNNATQTYDVNATDRGRSLMQHLNQTNNAAGRVHAMKTSHHGSKYSSSAAFINRLRPQAAFISCGTDNRHDHPDQPVVTALENAPCRYYMTGENLDGTAVIGPRGTVAGVFAAGAAVPLAPGHIRLAATEAGVGANPPTFRVHFARPNAGTNMLKNPAFAYVPWGRFSRNF
jgi:beta-lactamase superfamily II metal-dependent hydrolase